jgi:hypothetical protein
MTMVINLPSTTYPSHHLDKFLQPIPNFRTHACKPGWMPSGTLLRYHDIDIHLFMARFYGHFWAHGHRPTLFLIHPHDMLFYSTHPTYISADFYLEKTLLGGKSLQASTCNSNSRYLVSCPLSHNLGPPIVQSNFELTDTSQLNLSFSSKPCFSATMYAYLMAVFCAEIRFWPGGLTGICPQLIGHCIFFTTHR